MGSFKEHLHGWNRDEKLLVHSSFEDGKKGKVVWTPTSSRGVKQAVPICFGSQLVIMALCLMRFIWKNFSDQKT